MCSSCASRAAHQKRLLYRRRLSSLAQDSRLFPGVDMHQRMRTAQSIEDTLQLLPPGMLSLAVSTPAQAHLPDANGDGGWGMGVVGV